MVAQQESDFQTLKSDYLTQYSESNRLSFCKIALRQLHWVSTDTAETGEYVIQDENRRNLLQSFIDNNTSPTIEEFGNLIDSFTFEELIIIGF